MACSALLLILSTQVRLLYVLIHDSMLILYSETNEAKDILQQCQGFSISTALHRESEEGKARALYLWLRGRCTAYRDRDLCSRQLRQWFLGVHIQRICHWLWGFCLPIH